MNSWGARQQQRGNRNDEFAGVSEKATGELAAKITTIITPTKKRCDNKRVPILYRY